MEKYPSVIIYYLSYSYACTTSTSTNRNKMCMQSYWSVFISFHINLLRQTSITAGPVQNTKRILTHIVVY